MCHDCKVCPRAGIYICLDPTLYATIYKHKHLRLLHMDTSEDNVCKRQNITNTDYSCIIIVLSSKVKTDLKAP